MGQRRKPMTREELLANGACCGCGCLNCPYTPRGIKGSNKVKDEKQIHNSKNSRL